MKDSKETQMYRADFRTRWEKLRVGWFERIRWNTHITICEGDDQSPSDAWSEALKARTTQRGGQGGGHVYTCGWFMSLYGKNHHNVVKLLASNYNKLIFLKKTKPPKIVKGREAWHTAVHELSKSNWAKTTVSLKTHKQRRREISGRMFMGM